MSNPQDNDWLSEILERLVNTVGVAPHLLYHDEAEKEQIVANAIPKAKQAIQSKVDEMVRETRIDELHRQLENSQYAEDRTATEVRDRIEASIAQLSTNKKGGE